MNNDKQAIFLKAKSILIDLFELDDAVIVPEAKLYEDLDIDSIDAVDLLIDLKKEVDVEISPEQFKAARTLGDVVDIFADLSQNAKSS